jgi:hypothetical protein
MESAEPTGKESTAALTEWRSLQPTSAAFFSQNFKMLPEFKIRRNSIKSCDMSPGSHSFSCREPVISFLK